MTKNAGTAIKVRNLKVHFLLPRKSFMGVRPTVHAVDGVSFDVQRGQSFGIVGESGSGKTTTAMAIMRLVDITGGSIMLGEQSISEAQSTELRALRRKIQIIFQDPYSSLNPRMRAGAIVREPMDLMDVGEIKERDERVAELFSMVDLRPEQLNLFPHQFSGGQRQRIGIARALASRPEVIICDEPVSALDVAVQAQVINLLRKLQDEFGISYVFISHDLGVVQYICDEIAVMYLGKFVEQADRFTLFKNPLHPYTQALISAVPSGNPEINSMQNRTILKGDPPSPIDIPTGCRFAGRCPIAEDKCHQIEPAFRLVGENHRVACHLVVENGSQTAG